MKVLAGQPADTVVTFKRAKPGTGGRLKPYQEVVSEDPAWRVELQFDADGGQRPWFLVDRCCDNPACECTEVHVALFDLRARSQGPGLALPAPIEFRIDPFLGKFRFEKEPSQEEAAIARELADDLVGRQFLVRRRQLVRAWALSRWDGPTVAHEDRMSHLQEFAPTQELFAMPFVFEGREWFAMDQYCIRPGCNCHDTILSFYTEGNEGIDIPVKPRFEASLDIDRGTACLSMDGSPLDLEQRQVLMAFLAALDNWRDHLLLRRRLLRGTARRRLRLLPEAGMGSPLASPPAAVPFASSAPVFRGSPAPGRPAPLPVPVPVRNGDRKVGRNDPCPCGSGRKYKKCCEGKQGRQASSRWEAA